ncbi:MAG: GtrA family protein [Muribaculaceae bacterium]|nr:GtrA family protein [Muribaculaceae bacterium]
MKSTVNKLFVEPTNNWFIQLFRYVFVGGFAFIVDYGMLFALTEFCDLYYLLSATISFVAGLVVNYLLSTSWVFRSGAVMQNKLAEFTVFALIGLVGLLLNNVLLYLFTDICGVHYMISKLITTVLVMGWNFGARKHILFNKTSDKNENY